MAKSKKNVLSGEKTRQKVLDAYVNIYKQKGKPQFRDLKKAGLRDAVIYHFNNLKSVERAARKLHPDLFFDADIADIVEDSGNIKNIRDKIKKHKKFVVTTAVTGCPIDMDFYASIKRYCKLNDALLLVLTASDPAHTADNEGYGTIDKRLINECLVLEDTDLNSNLFLSTIKLSAKHIDPTTGLYRIGQREGSFIFASPKQRLHMVATSNVKLPHAVMTTGAITVPNYSTKRYMSERTAYLAEIDHVMGALIIEIEDNKIFHYRQIQSKKDGSFVDIGRRYTATKCKTERPAAVVLGDWHSGMTNTDAMICTWEILETLKPKIVVMHDLFDGRSVNHHEEFNQINKAMRFNTKAPSSLYDEIRGVYDDLTKIGTLVPNIVVVKSNHDEFLSKHYLQKAKYAYDPQNHYFALDLAKAMMEGKDPLAFAVNRMLDDAGYKLNIKWLQRDEDYKIAGIQLGAHGDKGSNGSRGSLKSVESAYKESVTGHSHTPGILRGAWAVGTSSELKMGYNEGPSSWMHTHCVVYEDGSRQLINIINCKWKAQLS